jgi:hypothetical protein
LTGALLAVDGEALDVGALFDTFPLSVLVPPAAD